MQIWTQPTWTFSYGLVENPSKFWFGHSEAYKTNNANILNFVHGLCRVQCILTSELYIEKYIVMNINEEDLQECTCIGCMLDSGNNGAFLSAILDVMYVPECQSNIKELLVCFMMCVRRPFDH